MFLALDVEPLVDHVLLVVEAEVLTGTVQLLQTLLNGHLAVDGLDGAPQLAPRLFLVVLRQSGLVLEVLDHNLLHSARAAATQRRPRHPQNSGDQKKSRRRRKKNKDDERKKGKKKKKKKKTKSKFPSRKFHKIMSSNAEK